MRENTNQYARKIVIPAFVAAVYTTLTILLAPISYGPFQFRISEALCALPFLFPHTVWGLFIGCAISNFASTAGILDVVFGSLATLLSCLCTAQLGKLHRQRGRQQSLKYPILSCAMPAIFNGPIIGAVLAYTVTPEAFWLSFALIGLQVAFGEIVVLYVLGLPLILTLEKKGFAAKYSGL